LDLINNTSETLAFFAAFKQKTLNDPADEMMIDLSKLQRISPDAALVLIAEATRSALFGCRLVGNRAHVAEVDSMLWQIGYYSYYEGPVGRSPVPCTLHPI
jgi:hypothetical protein